MPNKALRTLLLATTLISAPVFAQTPPAEEPTLKDKFDRTVLEAVGSPMANVDLDMKRVLDTLATLKPRPIIGAITAKEARTQPTIADAAALVMKEEGKGTQPSDVTAQDTTYKGANGDVPVRIYKPANASSNAPVVLYFHGGGFVIADLDTYDASPRAIAQQSGAIVVSAHYSQAPEYPFPAAHEDAVAAYKWVLDNAGSWGGDASKVAVMGESAGGNLAINVAIAARDQNLQAAVHQVLIYPLAGSNMQTASYEENDSSVPLNRPMMQWFVGQTFANEAAVQDKRIDLVGKADLKNLPPATVITAEIDPLNTEGQELAKKLKEAGVKVDARDYAGVTHEFFGLGNVVADAKDAQARVAANLKDAFGASEGRASTPSAQ